MMCGRLCNFRISIHSGTKPETEKGKYVTMTNEISIHSGTKPETSKMTTTSQGRLFQFTPAQSQRQRFYPNTPIINHHFLYKTSNFTLTSPNPITKTNHKPFFYQCESLHIFMFTYLSHYPVLFYYNTLPSIIPETFSPLPTPKDTLLKNIFDIPRPGILLLVPGLWATCLSPLL